MIALKFIASYSNSFPNVCIPVMNSFSIVFLVRFCWSCFMFNLWIQMFYQNYVHSPFCKSHLSLLFLKLFHEVSWAHGKLFSHRTALEKPILALLGLLLLKDFIHMSRQVNLKLTVLLHKNQALNPFTFFITPHISWGLKDSEREVNIILKWSKGLGW